MHYQLPQNLIDKYSEQLYVFRLYFAQGSRHVIYEDFDKLPKYFRKKEANKEIIRIEIEDIIQDIDTLSKQYDAVGWEFPKLYLLVYERSTNKLDAMNLIEVIA